MKSLSTFESNLNRILRCVVGRLPLAEALPLMVRGVDQPRCLSRECVDLVQDTLAKGVTQNLARQGWRDERFLKSGQPVGGRLWGRHSGESLGLTFSGNTLKMLMWLTKENAATSRLTGSVRVDGLTLGDHLFNLSLFDCVSETLVAPNLLTKPAMRDNALVWMCYPEKIAEYWDEETQGCTVDFQVWCRAENAWAMEVLQTRLSNRIESVERGKHRINNNEQLLRLGEIQTDVLSTFLAAADKAGRRDLSLFVLRSAGKVLSQFDTSGDGIRGGTGAGNWVAKLNVSELRLADRVQLYRAALSVFHVVSQLYKWQQEALDVSFYDDDYQSSQFWKAEWDRLGGDDIYNRSQAIIAIFNPLRISGDTGVPAVGGPRDAGGHSSN